MGIRNKFDPYVVGFTRWVLHWRWPLIVGTILAVMAMGSGGRFLSFATDYRIFFSKENPQLNAFEKLQDIYTKNDNVLFVLQPKGKKVFTPNVLNAIEELTGEGWKVPYSIRVDAVTNFQHTTADGDDLIVADLVENADQKTPADLEVAKTVAINDPQLLNIVISPGADIAGVNVTVQLPGKSIKEVPETVAYARELAKKIESKYPNVTIYLSGMVMLNNAFAEAAQGDIQSLIPLMYLGMILLMFFLLRSVWGTIATLLVIAFSTVSAMGLAGWMGAQLTPPSAQAPTMILTLAVADSIHILVTMLREMRLGLPKRDAIVESMRVNFSPVFMTSLTTVIGFLSLNFSDSPPFRHLGNIAATGMALAFVYSVVFLPAFISILPIKVRSSQEKKDIIFNKISDFVVRNRRSILWISASVVLFIALFIPKNELNDQFVEYFDERIQFRTDSDFTMEHLTGIYTVEHSLGAGESSGISNPSYLNKLEEFSNWYRQQPGILQVNSFSHVMKRLNKSMHGDDPNFFQVPESRELAAQYLLLYELSLPYGLDLNNQINVDKSATRFTATLSNLTTNEIKSTALRAEEWLRINAPESMFAHGVSPAVMFSYISERNINSMLVGTLLAVILISFCLIFTFRSVKFGLLSLIPNLVPAVMAFGLWGMLISKIGLALSIVTGMTLGIVVDDTVHFLNKYLRGRREQDLSPQGAVRYAFSSVGRALVVTSFILIGGFMVLSASAFKLNGAMGQMTALVIFLALIADFTLLPALLMKVDGGTEEETSDERIKVPQAEVQAH